MKAKLILLIFFSSTVFSGLVSCTKDDDDDAPKSYAVTDLWIGTYTVDQLPSQPPNYYSLSIEPNGNVLVEGKGGNGVTYYSAGTWTLTSDTLRCNFVTLNFAPGPQVPQSAKFFYDSSTGKLLNGTWRDEAVGSNSGKFPTMDRVN